MLNVFFGGIRTYFTNGYLRDMTVLGCVSGVLELFQRECCRVMCSLSLFHSLSLSLSLTHTYTHTQSAHLGNNGLKSQQHSLFTRMSRCKVNCFDLKTLFTFTYL